MKHFLNCSFAVLFMFCSTIVWGQRTVSGTVTSAEKSTIEGAIVTLYQPDTLTTIEYGMTDENGEFSLSTDEAGEMILEVSSFGFNAVYKNIPAGENLQEVEIQLTPLSYNIDEITIKDEEIGVSQEGDTLTFHIQNFTTGAERNLGDVLNRLPGLEVKDGAVYYNDEKITKMLVQGRDIINSNHELATEGIRADQIDKIKVLQNYKESDQKLETGRSDDVAMDVRLKESELDSWSGSAEALGGFPSSFKGEITAFNFNEKLGITAFSRGNNVGSQSIRFRDMQGMMDNNGGMFRRTWYINDNLIPSAIWIGDDLQENLDGSAVINLDFNPSEKVNVKGFLMGAYAERLKFNHREKEYFSDGTTEIEDKEAFSQTPLGNTMWKLSWDPDTATHVSANLPFTYSTSSTIGQRTGRLNQFNFKTDNDTKEENISFSPQVTYKRSLGDVTVLNSSVKMNMQNSSGFTYFTDINPFLGVPYEEVEGLYKLLQNKTSKQRSFAASVNTKSKWENHYFLNPRVEYSYYQNSLELNAEQEDAVIDFTSSDQLDQNNVSLSLQTGYESDDWRISLSPEMLALIRNYASRDERTDYVPGMGISINRYFNKAHNLALNSSYGLSYPSFDRVQNTYEVNSANSIRTGSIPAINIPTKTLNVSLNYHNYMPLQRTWIYGNASWSRVEDVFVSYNNQYENYYINAYLLSPGSMSANLSTGFGTRVFKLISVSPRVSFNYSKGNAVSDDLNFQDKFSFGQSYRVRLRSDWEFPLNVSASMSYRRNKSETRQRVQSFQSIDPELELEYSLGGFRAEVEYTYDYAEAAEETSILHLMEVELDYSLKNIPLTFKIEADNLLNLNPIEKVDVTNADAYFETRAYTIFPGYILAGVSYDF